MEKIVLTLGLLLGALSGFTFPSFASDCSGGSCKFYQKKVPPGWTCIPEYYNDGNGCDCNCGAYDPDCDDPNQKIWNCEQGEICDHTGHCRAPCTPDCTGKECGDDGCGGSCGTCPSDNHCEQGKCVCTPDCTGKECGDDGCGGSCGTCSDDLICKAGRCILEGLDGSERPSDSLSSEVVEPSSDVLESTSAEELEEMEVFQEDEVVETHSRDIPSTLDIHHCPDGQVYKYGACYKPGGNVVAPSHSGGCTVSQVMPTGSPIPLFIALLTLFLWRRNPYPRVK